MAVSIVTRAIPSDAASALAAQGCHPVLARVLAARGIVSLRQMEPNLAGLLPPQQLSNAMRMAALLADAIAAQKRLLIVADYDADGATACAVGVRGLRMFGAQVAYLVPNRFAYGYGLTPEIVALAAEQQPDILLTVDNGIASVEGVRAAHARGMEVLVTDHHLPGDELPPAACIVNPNQAGCAFPSKHLAGVGVMFYVLLALRAELRARGGFMTHPEPNPADLLDLVALGTVADLVRLDDNNRILVEQGLRRMRAGKACAGIQALLRVAGRDPRRANTQDLGFSVAPRLNAAGRLQDMSLGIECLLAENESTAYPLAQRLDALNRERRDIETDMHATALLALEAFDPRDHFSITLFQPDWHQGVIGILASRLKERFHRPAIVFAPGADGALKGSGRSIPGLHLRDALDLLSKRETGLLLRFGGHAMAAGLTIAMGDLQRFQDGFEAVVRGMLTQAQLARVIETDGGIPADDFDLALAEILERPAWGQGFAAPQFVDQFEVAQQRVVGERHLKLKLLKSGRMLDAILFNDHQALPATIRAVYQLGINEYQASRQLQLVLRHWEPVA